MFLMYSDASVHIDLMPVRKLERLVNVLSSTLVAGPRLCNDSHMTYLDVLFYKMSVIFMFRWLSGLA
jgi:hypothetical protein